MRLFQIIKDYRAVLSLFFITIFLGSNLAGQNKNMVFKTISKEQGLSNNFINAISQDRQGFLWIGTWNGLYRYDGYHFKAYKPVESDPAIISNGIRFFAEDKNDRIWIISPSELTMYDKKKDKFKCVYSNDLLANDYFTSLFLDSKGILWLGTQFEGLWALPVSDAADFSKIKPMFKRYEHDNNNPNSISTNSIFGAFEDKESNIWINASNKIVDRYNPETGTFKHYPINVPNLEKQAIRVIMNLEDSDGLYWLATFGAGLISWDIKHNIFKQYVNEPGKNSLSGNVITHIRQARDGILWISTDGGGISLYNKKTGVFDYCKYEAANPNSLSSDGINLTFEDRSGVIWIGNTNAGLNQDEAEKTNFGLHRPILSDNNSLSYKSVTSIIEDKERNFWIGTDGGGLNFWNKKTQKFRHFLNDPKNSNSISGNAVVCLAKDYEGNIWIGTYAHGLNCYKRKKDTFVRFTHDPADTYSISSNNIWAVLEDRKHNLWVSSWKGH
jgi:ligand-binding sensor domain-containing protein